MLNGILAAKPGADTARPCADVSSHPQYVEVELSVTPPVDDAGRAYGLIRLHC